MKSFFLFILFTSALFAQPYYTFTDLRGMEDSSGVTHLFYGTYLQTVGELSYHNDYDIYHFNTSNSVDTVFFQSGSYDHKYFGGDFSFISDFEFWNNNPSLYISCGGQGSDEAGPFVQRFDDELPNFMPSFGSVDNIEISKQNDSLVYTGGTELFKSTDGGRSWGNLLENAALISLSPFDDKTVFITKNNELNISSDGGVTFTSLGITDYFSSFIYDNDSLHIYSPVGNHLYLSDNEGIAGSWEVIYSGTSRIFISADPSVSGLLYLAEGNKIYSSNNYGITFSLFKQLDGTIFGIYNKPTSEILYAITKYRLYEINNGIVNIIKELSFNPALQNHYPLAVGNKWVYKKTLDFDDLGEPNIISYYTRVVNRDTVINDKQYFIIEDNEEEQPQYFYERMDSINSIIYRYSLLDSAEYSLEDLKAERLDTIYSKRYQASQVVFMGSVYSPWEYHPGIKYQEIDALSGRSYSMIYGIGIDQIEYSFDFGFGNISLQGALINNKLYGNTTLVTVDDEIPVVAEFSLSQNYPNPFNPVTNISYSIKSRGNVTLKVYDILGKEVATLVNEEKPAGNYEVTFNGSELASGVYIYRLLSGKNSQSKKILLVK